jgi:hypothetical protein
MRPEVVLSFLTEPPREWGLMDDEDFLGPGLYFITADDRTYFYGPFDTEEQAKGWWEYEE